MSIKEYIVSSPGKIILHGEHAVVYGKKALACSLDLRTVCHLKETNDDLICIDLPSIQIKQEWPIKYLENSLQFLSNDATNPCPASPEVLHKLKETIGLADDTADTKNLAVVAFMYLFGIISKNNRCLPSVTIQISSDLPTSAGLGSSAAYSTCLAACLLWKSNIIDKPVHCNGQSNRSWSDKDLHLVNSWAFQGERIIHGNPSGIDNSVSTFGGALIFQSGTISPIEKIPSLRVLLVNTKVPRSTKTLVAGVRERYEKYQEIISPVLDSIEAICDKCTATFTEILKKDCDLQKQYNTLQDLLEMNQRLLEILGVSHDSLQTVCLTAKQFNLIAKLTGAGGGGCAFILIPPDIAERIRALFIFPAVVLTFCTASFPVYSRTLFLGLSGWSLGGPLMTTWVPMLEDEIRGYPYNKEAKLYNAQKHRFNC